MTENLSKKAILLLINVARAAHHAMDNSEELADGNSLLFPPWSKDLEKALDALDELPDDMPQYVMNGAGKAEWALRDILKETV